MAFQDLNNSFSDIAVENRINLVDSFLKEINSLIDFKKLKSILNKNNIGNKSTCGVKAYDNILMFRILLLQKFYNMSDKRVESELNTNLLYMNFTGLSIETMSPDSSTICRFRNSLIKNKLYDELFENVNKQLTNKGLIVETGKDILMDATLTKSNNDTIKYKTKDERSEDKKKLDLENRTLDLLIEEELKKEKPSMKRISKMVKQKERYSRTFKNKQLDEKQKRDTKIIETSDTIIDKEEDSYNHKERIDKDIRIGYQAGKKQYASGYKNHIITDATSGAILKNKTSFANTADIQAVETMVTDIDNVKSFGADKAYKSKEVDEFLKERNIDNDVCLKERKSMSDEQRAEFRESEKPKHKIRAKVEHSFALIKTQMQQHTTRFIGLVRNNMNFTITCIAANLKLFAHKQIRARKVIKVVKI